MSDISHLNIIDTHLLHLGSVPLVINKLSSAQVILLWRVSSCQWRVGHELFSQVIHQFLKSFPVFHVTGVQLAFIGNLSDKYFGIVNLSVLIESSFLLFLNGNLINKYL